MDWSTVLASAGVSAIVGTLVSLLAVSTLTTRQRMAERRDQARQQIKVLVAPVLAAVVKYRAGINRGLRKEEENRDRMTGDDYVLASRVLTQADQLGAVRRWLVMRRSRRLFGPFIAELAALNPTPGDSMGNVLAPLIVATNTDSRFAKMSMEKRFGTLHHALFEEPSSPAVKRLERDLRRLAAAW